KYVIGFECALASSFVSQSSFPFSELNARNRESLLAPMKTRPPAVATLPPRFGDPVLRTPIASSASILPNTDRHAISPELRSTATNSPKGGFWHGMCVSRSQNRAYGPYAEVRTNSDPCFSRWPHCPTFMTLTNNKPRSGSTETPPQFPPPKVLGNNNAFPSSGSGVYGGPIFI